MGVFEVFWCVDVLILGKNSGARPTWAVPGFFLLFGFASPNLYGGAVQQRIAIPPPMKQEGQLKTTRLIPTQLLWFSAPEQRSRFQSNPAVTNIKITLSFWSCIRDKSEETAYAGSVGLCLR